MPARSQLVYSVSERGREVFSCPLQCERCAGRTAEGRRCSRRACFGVPFCWTHSRQLVGLQVKDFPGMGKGLVAVRKGPRPKKAPAAGAAHKAIVFKKGEYIMPYIGEILTRDEYERRYVVGTEDSVAEYVIIDGAGRYVDGACRRTLPVIANTVVSKKERTDHAISPAGPVRYVTSVLAGTNSKFTVRTKAHEWHGIPVPAKSDWFIATKDIREGDQLLAYYGNAYRIYTTPGYQTSSTKRRTVKRAPVKRAPVKRAAATSRA